MVEKIFVEIMSGFVVFFSSGNFLFLVLDPIFPNCYSNLKKKKNARLLLTNAINIYFYSVSK